ncbi:hypothetical protein FACS1894141_7120 [Spirochaetia bacterium]|nr:hypothetical protein FACS1894141_7120 [Spirochaetia bacterium]
MTVTKVTSKFTEEERAVLKKIYKIRAKMQKDMEGMTQDERIAYINKGAPPPESQSSRPKKRSTTKVK